MSDDSDDIETALEGLPATRRNQQFASAVGLRHSLASEDYPEFLAMEGPANNLDPCVNSELDFLWPTALCSLIADKQTVMLSKKSGNNG